MWADYLPLAYPSDVRALLLTPESLLSLSAAPDSPIGITFSGDTVTSGIPHGLDSWTAIQFQTTGTLPSPLVADTTYYEYDLGIQNQFKVASAIGGAPITLTGSGSGQMTVRNWALNDVIEAKGILADRWMYTFLKTEIIKHVRALNPSIWLWMYPPTNIQPQSNFLSPARKAELVLNNLLNAGRGSVESCSISTPGTGYAVGDKGILVGGNDGATYRITDIVNGLVTGVCIENSGVGYTLASVATTTTTGSGSGLHLTVTTLYAQELLDAAVFYRLWAMGTDGSWRNQIIDQTFLTQFGPTLESTLKKRAEERLMDAIQGLLIGTADGASTVFDFDMTTSTIGTMAL